MRCAVLGDPIAHSLSPVLHRAGYAALGLDWTYDALRVGEDALAGVVAGLGVAAWVSWRYSGDVVGWAPLAPGLSLYVTDFAFVDFWWTFVPTVRFCDGPVYRYAYAPHYTRRWWDATRPAPPRPAPPGGAWAGGRPRPAAPAWGGPSSRFVEERSGRLIRPSRIVPARAAGERSARPGEIQVFRPEARLRPAPGSSERRAPAVEGPRSRGWDGARPSAPGRASPAPSQPRGEVRGGRSDSGWDGARPAPRSEGRAYAPTDRGERRGAAPQAPRAEAAPQPRASAPAPAWSPAPRAAPAPSYAPPAASARGEGGGRGGDGGSGHPARPAPPGGGERGGHRR